MYSIVPYFSLLLLEQVKTCKMQEEMLLFHKSLNPVCQSKQMDVLKKVWNVNRVSTFYFTSTVVRHATVDMLVDELYDRCFSCRWTVLTSMGRT